MLAIADKEECSSMNQMSATNGNCEPRTFYISEPRWPLPKSIVTFLSFSFMSCLRTSMYLISEMNACLTSSYIWSQTVYMSDLKHSWRWRFLYLRPCNRVIGKLHALCPIFSNLNKLLLCVITKYMLKLIALSFKYCSCSISFFIHKFIQFW